MHRKAVLCFSLLFLASLVVFGFQGCGKKKPAYDKNLLVNSSFEGGTDKNGLPENWTLELFHGLKGSKEVKYGVTDSVKFEGRKAFYFQGDPNTETWYALVQEVEVPETKHIRLRGAIKLRDVWRNVGQWTQCNFILIYYDKNHQRFQDLRFGDKRTVVKYGTSDWFVEDKEFRVPRKTKYIKVGCILGMQGTVWFDDISLSIPKPIGWVKKSTKNFDFYSLPEKDYPPGAIENEQGLFDHYCKALGVKSDVRISYYFYPDTASIKKILSLKSVRYVSWDDKEIHSIYPNDNHEIIHFITDEYGRPPRAIAEGSAYYLIGDWAGKPIHLVARVLLLKGRLPSIKSLVNYGDFVAINPNWSLPASASFFGYLYEHWGPVKILELFGAANGSNSYPTFSAAFLKVYHIPLEKVEKLWRSFLAKGDFDYKNNDEESQRSK